MSEDRRPAPSATSDMPVPVVPEPVVAPVPVPVVAPVPVPSGSVPAVPPVEPQPGPEHGPIAARFSQLAAQRREADARAERLERTATEYKTQLETALAALTKIQPSAPAPAVPTSGETRPNRESFADAESFETALVSWAGSQAASTAAAELRRAQEEADSARQEAVRVAEEARAREAREAEETRTAREMQSSWETRRAKAIEAHPDFSEVAEVDSLPITLAMGHMIVTHEDGPEIAYYLGKNPQEAARIAALTVPGQTFPAGHPQAGLPVPNAVAQSFELGKIAAKLGNSVVLPASEPAIAEPTVVAPATVVLPAPPSPISGASAAAMRRDPSEMSMEEYAAHRAPQLLSDRRPSRIH